MTEGITSRLRTKLSDHIMSLPVELLEPLNVTPADTKNSPKMQSFLQQIRQDLEDLEVAVSIQKVDKETRRVTLLLEGTDAQAGRNYIAKQYGATTPFANVKAGMRLLGVLRDPAKVGFGLFVDAGIIDPSKDVLIPLRVIRAQIAKEKTLPLRPMARTLGLVEGYPLGLEITYANPKIGKIEASFSPAQVDSFRDWLRAKNERVLFAGATRQHVKNALKQTGHEVDVLALERQGLQAGYVVLKSGTQAPGIIHAIGSLLPEARLGAYNPSQWTQLFQTGNIGEE